MLLPTRANFCASVRNALGNLGYSYYRVLNACNSALGQMVKVKQGENKTKDVKVGKATKTKQATINVNLTPGSIKFQSAVNAPLLFVAWNDAVANVQKIATTPVEIPVIFQDWLKSKDFKPNTEESKQEADEKAVEQGRSTMFDEPELGEDEPEVEKEENKIPQQS